MTARLAETVRRAGHHVLTFGVVSGALLFLAWQIISRAMAVVYETTDPEQALNWNPQDSTALLELAEHRIIQLPVKKAVAQKSLEEARLLTERALRSDPLASGALTDLGQIAEKEGDAGKAANLMELAAKRALRDAAAQGWLVGYALDRSDFAAAVSHLDTILRAHPDARDQTLPLLAAFISDVRAKPSLLQVLQADPPWRTWFLRALPSYMGDLDALREFYGAVEASPRSITQLELEPYLDRLVNDGFFREAFAAWVGALPPSRHSSEALYNGAFQYQLSGSEFDWRIVQSVGADVEIVGGPSEPQTLLVEFSGAKVDFHNVSHLLVLPPGRYKLTGKVQTVSLHTRRGVWWRMFCAERPGPSLGQTALVADSMPWQAFTLPFSVPATGCKAQVLQLELPARIALEQVISGVVSYRDLAIAPMPDNVESKIEQP